MAFPGGIDDRGVCVILYFPYLFCDGKPSVYEVEKFLVDLIDLAAVLFEIAHSPINGFIVLIWLFHCFIHESLIIDVKSPLSMDSLISLKKTSTTIAVPIAFSNTK